MSEFKINYTQMTLWGTRGFTTYITAPSAEIATMEFWYRVERKGLTGIEVTRVVLS